MKKNKVVWIVIALCAFTIGARGESFSFIQRPGFSLSDKPLFSAEYVYNYSSWWHIMDNPGNESPSYDKDSAIHFYRTSFSYKKFDFNLAVSQKNKKEYYWADECKEHSLNPNLDFAATIQACLVKGRYANFGISLYNFAILGFMFNKQVGDFSYALILEESALSLLLKPTLPYSATLGVAYSLTRNLWLFNELKIHKYYSSAKSGYMNMVGVTYKYKNISTSLFYNLIHDDDNYSVGACPTPQRTDHRIGCQLKIEH